MTEPIVGQFAHVVVALDGSDTAERALPVARALAEAGGSRLSLVTAAVHEDHIPTARRIQRKAAAALGRPVDTEVVVGQPAATPLLAFLERHHDAVVVMTTHARTAIGELLLGSVADEVVGRSPIPVVLVGPDVKLPEAGAAYHDVIVCVDGTPPSELLLPVAAAMHHELHMHPWLFEVVRPGDGHGARFDVFESAYVHRAADTLHQLGIEADWDTGHDRDTARAIVRFAEDRIDPVIAIATHGRHPRQRISDASVTVTVARAAPCPVLVLGPGFVRPTVEPASTRARSSREEVRHA